MIEILWSLVTIICVLSAALTVSAALIWLERRLLGLWQDRYGPNRAGPFGLLQVAADGIKIFFKEDWIPPFADKPVFVMAPAVVVITMLMVFAVICLPVSSVSISTLLPTAKTLTSCSTSRIPVSWIPDAGLRLT